MCSTPSGLIHLRSATPCLQQGLLILKPFGLYPIDQQDIKDFVIKCNDKISSFSFALIILNLAEIILRPEESEGL